MAPKLALHMKYYKLWLERLEGCCEYCGEMHDNFPFQALRTNTRKIEGLHAEYDGIYENVTAGGDNKTFSPDSQSFKRVLHLKNDHQDMQIIWKSYESRKLIKKSKSSQRKPIESRMMMLSYSQHQMTSLSETFRRVIDPSRNNTIELIVDTTSDDDDTDLYEDLLDAYKLTESGVTTEYDNV